MHVLICHNLIIERYGKQMKTGAQVIEEMRKRGETVTAWANKNGFTVQQVQNVVCGRAKGNWGIDVKLKELNAKRDELANDLISSGMYE